MLVNGALETPPLGIRSVTSHPGSQDFQAGLVTIFVHDQRAAVKPSLV